jgi:outer membrane protein assembly factor BamD
MKLYKLIILLVLFAATNTACNKFSKVVKSKDYEYKLKMADEYYANKKFKYAQQLYEELFPILKGTQKFEEMYYKDAYCFYNMKLYRDAQNLFKGYLEVFPNSAKAEEADYMHAYCFYKQSPKVELEQVNTNKAMNMMQTFINTHPGSEKIKEATEIIDKCREKLEQKEFRSAELYFNLGQYKASAIAFTTLGNNYPESVRGEEYRLRTVKSYYRYAKLSIIDKQIERFQKVTSEYQDFVDRYPESKLLKDAENYSNLSINNIKAIQNEQIKTSANR